ncbi:MAG: SDR family oxidoreductase [Chloroflexi bacterium]|nr:SDR family oxidoreductase [Chloroflexota bacterium]
MVTALRVLITGANRGLGLALVRLCLQRGDHVFAAARRFDALEKLDSGGRLFPVPLDVDSGESIAAAVDTVREHAVGLDLLINNAGIFPRAPAYASFGHIEAAALREVLQTNTIGPLLVAQAFLPLLHNGSAARIINITSQQGSLQWKTRGGSLSYSVSKAALNMLTRVMAAELRPQGIIAAMIHPGWVQTDMGSANAALSADQSAAYVLRIVDRLTLEDSGAFFNYDGSPHPW